MSRAYNLSSTISIVRIVTTIIFDCRPILCYRTPLTYRRIVSSSHRFIVNVAAIIAITIIITYHYIHNDNDEKEVTSHHQPPLLSSFCAFAAITSRNQHHHQCHTYVEGYTGVSTWAPAVRRCVTLYDLILYGNA